MSQDVHLDRLRHLLNNPHICVYCDKHMDDHAEIPGKLYGKCLFSATTFVSAGQLLQIVAIKHRMADSQLTKDKEEITRHAFEILRSRHG